MVPHSVILQITSHFNTTISDLKQKNKILNMKRINYKKKRINVKIDIINTI
jgi:hypothetical protein